MKNKNVDMTSGPLMSKMIVYTIPVIFTGILQLLYNAADLVVIGQFAGNDAFAAVGVTPALYSLFTNLFIGISNGGCICVAQYYGARDGKNVSETVHTSILASVFAGVVLGIVGFFCVEDVLELMGTPPEIIKMSTLYMKIVFLSMPFMLFFNFAAGILRATGDTKRPFYILMFTGMVNLILNLVFVIVFKMSVAGVALATAIGSLLNAIIAWYLLVKSCDSIKLEFRSLKIYKDKLKIILANGIPLGVQSLVFSVSNVIIQSSVNSFNSIAVVAGNSAASNIEGFIYTAMNSIANTALNFSAQNFGAREYKRIDRVVIDASIMVTVTGVIMGVSAAIFSQPLLSIYQPDDLEAIRFGTIRMIIIGTTYFLCGLMDTVSYTMKGMGMSIITMSVMIVSVVGIRIGWILTVFRKMHTLQTLYVSWPITWFSAIIILLCIYIFGKKKVFEKNEHLYHHNSVPNK